MYGSQGNNPLDEQMNIVKESNAIFKVLLVCITVSPFMKMTISDIFRTRLVEVA